MSQDTYRLISQTQAEYGRCIDDGRLEDWPGFFVDEGCVYKVTTMQNHRDGLPAGLIYADSHGMLLDRVSALRQANIYEQQNYRHFFGQPAILSDADGEATTDTSFLVVRIMRDGKTDLFASGRYLDRWRVTGDTAKLAERIVVCDSSRIDTLLALPL
jgi:anthranilate 1,2-dioxygenase small subunit